MFLKLALRLVALGLLLFTLNYFLFKAINFSPYIPLVKTYVFIVALSLFILFLIYLIAKEFPEFVGYSFMFLSLVKMGFTIFFLWAFIKSNTPEKAKHLLSFMIPYLIFLALETREAIRLNSNN